jgi:hypothetical protein
LGIEEVKDGCIFKPFFKVARMISSKVFPGKGRSPVRNSEFRRIRLS